MTKVYQHVSDMMTTAVKKFHNFVLSRFLIIIQNVNMVANGICNSRLNPTESIPEDRRCLRSDAPGAVEEMTYRLVVYIKCDYERIVSDSTT